MPTFTALTTLMDKEPAEALGEALERLDPAPTGVGRVRNRRRIRTMGSRQLFS